MASTVKNGHGVCANVLVVVLFAAFPQAMVHGQAVVTISQPPPSDCPYPCLPPPTTPAIYPPPLPPSPPLPPFGVYPPPSMVYPPPGGYFPYYFPPPWYLGNAPPPPDPILPYFPWYYKQPLVPNSSSETRLRRSWVMILSLLLMIVSLALSG
ncbi:leucine-rich repeat extensin-like protein 3 [Syzygium oleosum]|uniref:leucine-rich repeat extensin-like protein 3 n=1 Tax=Syzygium oleosum TaxID=219896 RepID=UPI0011D1B740|nr:leucine-rich repeat extensin-like protein 3 [Syzygium oleosum]